MRKAAYAPFADKRTREIEKLITCALYKMALLKKNG